MLTWLLIVTQALAPAMAWAQTKPKAGQQAQPLGPFRVSYQGSDTVIDFKKAMTQDWAVFPSDLRQELKLFFADHPDFETLKVQVRKVSKSSPEIEIAIAEAIVRLNPNDLKGFVLTWTDPSKKARQLTFDSNWAKNPKGFLQDIMPSSQVSQEGVIQLLDYKTLKNLPLETQTTYWQHLRQLLIATEALWLLPKKKTAHFKWDFFLGHSLWANQGGVCLTAGYQGTWDNQGHCKVPDSETQVLCNPLIFGDNVRVPKSNQNPNLTEACHQLSPTQKFAKEYFKAVTNEQQFNTKMLDLENYLKQEQATCRQSAIVTSEETREAQCETFKKRAKELRAIQCQQVLTMGCSPTREDTGAISQATPEPSTPVTTSTSKPSRKKKDSSWFKPWMGVTLAAGFGLAFFYWNHKQTMKQYYDSINPGDVAPPVTPPGLNPVPPPPALTNPPPPVDVPRQAPSAIQ